MVRQKCRAISLFMLPIITRLPTMKTPWRKLYVLSIAGGLSWLGSTLTTFAVILRDKDAVGASGVATYLLAFTLPNIFMAPVAGWVADRFSSRQVIVPALMVMGLSSYSLALGWPTWWTPGALLITATVGTMVGPAMSAAQAAVTQPEDMPRVTGLMQSLSSAGMLFAPALGGILVSTTGYFWPFVIDAGSFWLLATAFFVIGINRKPDTREEHEKIKAVDGLRFVMGDPLIRSLVILTAVVIVSLGALNVGEVFLVKDELHASNFIYGVVGAMFAAGSIAGSVLTASLKLPARLHALGAVAGILAIVISQIALAMAQSWWVALVANVIAGIGNAALNAYAIGILMGRTPKPMLGRSLAAVLAIISSGNVLGIMLCGWAITLFHVRPVLLIGGIISAITMAILSPNVLRFGRDFDAPIDGEADPA
jgi:MFS family permease